VAAGSNPLLVPDRSGGLEDMAADDLRVLLVEDDPHEADLVELGLSRAGFHPIVERVEDEEAFRRVLHEFAPDVIIARDSLLAFSGAQALGAAREQRPDVPFVLLAGTVEGDLAIEETPKRGALDLVQRDRLEEIGPTIRHVLAEVRGEVRENGEEEAPGADATRAHESYFALVEEAPIGVLTVDDQLRLTYVNSATERFWGRRRDELVGKVVWDLFPRISEPKVASLVRDFLTSGKSARFETHNPESDRWFEVHANRTEKGYSASFLDVTDRHRAQEQRQVAEARYKTLVEEIPAVTYLVQEEGLLFVSPQVETLVGYTADECQGDLSTVRGLVHPDDLEWVRGLFEAAQQRGIPYEAEYRLVTKDGRTIWVHDRATRVIEPDGRTLMRGAMFDITERKSAGESLRRRDAILEAVAFAAEHLLREWPRKEAVLDVLAKLGEAAGVRRAAVFEVEETPEGQVLLTVDLEWAAPGLEPLSPQIQGLDVTPVGGREILARVRKGEVITRDLQHLPASQRRLMESVGVTSELEVPLLIGGRAIGALAFMETRGPRTWHAPTIDAMKVAASVLGAAIEAAHVRDALEQSESQFRDLAEKAHDVIFRYRILPELSLEYMSPSATAVTGYAPEELLADPDFWTKLIHPDDRYLLRPALSQPFEFSGPLTLRAIRKDGTIIWLEIQVVFLRDAEGNVEAIHGIARDVTERIRAQEDIKASLETQRAVDRQRQLLVQRLVTAQEEERLRIANDIHDDSIQLMTAVGMRLALLRSQLRECEEAGTVAKLEETVQEAIVRLRNLIFELRPAALDREGLSPALREYIVTSHREDAPEVSLKDELQAEPSPETRVLLYRLTQEALTNVRKHARASHVDVDLVAERGGTRITVTDDGVGFDPEAVVGVTPGNLGLISMRERAELAGGWCRVTSAPGAGTTVDFWIPEPKPEGTGEAHAEDEG
jgi:PAS domain S-box-containing protein